MAECVEMSETAAGRSGTANGTASRPYWHLTLPSAARTRMLFAGAALVACGLVALVVWMTWDAYRIAWERAIQASGNLTATLANDIKRNIKSYDLSLQAVIAGLSFRETTSLRPDVRDALLFDLAASAPQFGAIRVTDANGHVILDSRGDSRDGAPGTPGDGETLAGRDFFRALRDGSATGLFIGVPFRDAASGDWLIALARRLDGPDGGFAGVVVGALRLDYLRRLFESVALDADASITLFRADRTIMARMPFDEQGIGRRLTEAPIFRHVEASAAGIFEDVSAFDGQRRVFTYRTLDGLPLVLAVGQSSDLILAEWRLKAALIGVVVFGLVAIVALLAAVLHAELRHRDRAESELAQKNAALAAILSEMPDGMQVFDRDGQLIAWNEQVFRLADLDAAQRDAILTAPDRARAFRSTLARRGDYGPGDPDELVAGREATARAGRPVQMRRQSASGRWIEIRGVPTTNGGWLGSYRDVSEEVARERELAGAYERLRAAKEEAETASRTKSEFLANMSHELRTPLNAVIGFSDMIRNGMVGSEEKARSYAGDIYSSGQYLLNLINDILEVSRIEAGKLVLHEEAVDLGATVDAALRMVESEAARAGVGIHKTAGQPQGQALPKLMADQRRVSQVLLNLLSNAVKFTPEGGTVQVTIWRRGGAMGVVIADTGIGIAADDIPRVLEPFGQVDSQLSRKYTGTGLGLPLSVRLMQLHGGRLEIDSTLGAGTAVTITFPADRVLPDSRAA
jgi:signal transduction histidine kinase